MSDVETEADLGGLVFSSHACAACDGIIIAEGVSWFRSQAHGHSLLRWAR